MGFVMVAHWVKHDLQTAHAIDNYGMDMSDMTGKLEHVYV